MHPSRWESVPCAVAGCLRLVVPLALACDEHRCARILPAGVRCLRPAGPSGDRPSGMCQWCESGLRRLGIRRDWRDVRRASLARTAASRARDRRPGPADEGQPGTTDTP